MVNKFIKEIYNEAELKSEGFVCNNKMIILAPIKDLISGFFFDKTQSFCYLHWFVQPIYYPSLYVNVSYGGRLEMKNKLFSLDTEGDIQFAKTEMIRLIKETKQIVLDIGFSMDFYNKFYDLSVFEGYKRYSIDPFLHKEMMAITLCYARYKDYKNIINEALVYWNTSDRTQLPWMQDIATRLKRLKAAYESGTDRELFDEWKDYTVKNLRLEKYYQPCK